MNKTILRALMTLLAASALTTNIAVAEGPGPGYLGDSSGKVVRDSAGDCVRTSSWSKENATKECNPELFPEEKMVEAPPPTPAPPPMPVYQKVTLSATALFDFNKAVLKEQGKTAIHDLDQDIKNKGAQIVDINVVGYTDSTGPEEYNMQLSIRRATAVKDYMVSEGIDPGLIDVIGKGEADPVASNATAAGRAQNRRVEIHIGANEPK